MHHSTSRSNKPFDAFCLSFGFIAICPFVLAGAAPAQPASPPAAENVCQADGADPGSAQESAATDSALLCREIRAIVAAVGTSGNFVLEQTNEDVTASTVHGEQNVIIYNKKLVENLKQTENRWIARLFLAHEIGHHHESHSRLAQNVAEKAKRELEADRFSGMAIAKLGGSFDQMQAGFMTYEEIGGDGYPPREERLAAGKSGWLAVKAPHESFSMAFPSKNSGKTIDWHKQGIDWTTSIAGAKAFVYRETMRDDDYLTLTQADSLETLMIPLVDGDVLSHQAGTEERDFKAIAKVHWRSDPFRALSVAIHPQENPPLGDVPVRCQKKGTAGLVCASPQEKVAIRDIVRGRWRSDANVIYPADWHYRDEPMDGPTVVEPGSASLFAKHNFKATLVTDYFLTTYGELRAMRKAGQDTSGYDTASPLPPPNGPPAAPADQDAAAMIGAAPPVVSPSTPILPQRRSERPADDGNYVALRYVMFKDGKPIESEGYVPIVAAREGWSAIVSYRLLDEQTAGADDRLMQVELTCSARRSLSIEAFSAGCQKVWEAMTRTVSWSQDRLAALTEAAK
jgi:hypothetical protein